MCCVYAEAVYACNLVVAQTTETAFAFYVGEYAEAVYACNLVVAQTTETAFASFKEPFP